MEIRAGVDLGGTKIQAVVVDGDGAVLGQSRHMTPKKDGPKGVAGEIVEALRDALAEAEVEPSALSGVGIGSPGDIDDDGGVVTQAINVTPDWTGSYPLAGAVGEGIGCGNVRLGNDVTVGTLAEFRLGAGRPYDSILGVFWGTGVGSGIILNREIWNGRGAAGEIGHMVINQGGALCGCGRHGCVEAYAGRGSMERHARALTKDGRKTKLFAIMKSRKRTTLTSGVWAKALERDDKLAVELIDRATEALGAGIASAVNLLDVDAVIIGGGLGTRLGEPYVERIRERTMPHLFVDDRPPPVLPAALGDLGGAIGAALQAEAPVAAR
ncbi:MAG: glucokinase [Gaiellales bacterium]|nr:glucokinase [Gaiellales bacterium]